MASASNVSATNLRSARVPTPVRNSCTSISPTSSRFAHNAAAGFSASGTSRMDGAAIGIPP
jgi:hypothetical protein